LDKRWRIPQKTNDQAWKDLELKIAHDEIEHWQWRKLTGTAKLAKLDDQIAKLGKQRESIRKNYKLRQLHDERARMLARYF
jgi:hypothetical protein